MAYLNGHFPESSVVNVEHLSLVFEYREHLYKCMYEKAANHKSLSETFELFKPIYFTLKSMLVLNIKLAFKAI